MAAAARDLCAEGDEVKPVGQDRGAVDRRQSGDRRDRTPQIFLPLVAVRFLALARDKARQLVRERLDGVEHRRHYGFEPRLGPCRHHQQCAAAPMSSH